MHIIATVGNEVAYFKNTCIALNTSRHLYEADTECVKRKTQKRADAVKQEQMMLCAKSNGPLPSFGMS